MDPRSQNDLWFRILRGYDLPELFRATRLTSRSFQFLISENRSFIFDYNNRANAPSWVFTHCTDGPSEYGYLIGYRPRDGRRIRVSLNFGLGGKLRNPTLKLLDMANSVLLFGVMDTPSLIVADPFRGRRWVVALDATIPVRPFETDCHFGISVTEGGLEFTLVYVQVVNGIPTYMRYNSTAREWRVVVCEQVLGWEEDVEPAKNIVLLRDGVLYTFFYRHGHNERASFKTVPFREVVPEDDFVDMRSAYYFSGRWLMEFQYYYEPVVHHDIKDVEEIYLYRRNNNDEEYEYVSSVLDHIYYPIHLPSVSFREVNGEVLLAVHSLHNGNNHRCLFRYHVEDKHWAPTEEFHEVEDHMNKLTVFTPRLTLPNPLAAEMEAEEEEEMDEEESEEEEEMDEEEAEEEEEMDEDMDEDFEEDMDITQNKHQRGNVWKCAMWGAYAEPCDNSSNEMVIVVLQHGRSKEWGGMRTVQNHMYNEALVEANDLTRRLILKDGASSLKTPLSSHTTYPFCTDFMINAPRKHETNCVVVGTIRMVEEDLGCFYKACRKCHREVIPENLIKAPIHSLWCLKCECMTTSLVPILKVPFGVQDKSADMEGFPHELCVLNNKLFALKILVSNYNLEKKYSVYTAVKVCDDPEELQAGDQADEETQEATESPSVKLAESSQLGVAKQKRDEFIEALGEKKLILVPWCDEEEAQEETESPSVKLAESSQLGVAKQKRDDFIEALGEKKLILVPWCDEEVTVSTM